MNEDANSDSGQSDIVCRFCLDGAKTGANPLLEPCVCRGSIQFVHLLCLNRWRLQGTGDSRDTCPICHTIYRIEFEDSSETIPSIQERLKRRTN